MGTANKAKKASLFVFDRYVLNRSERSASFFYHLDTGNGTAPVQLEEKIYFPVQKINWNKVNKKLLDKTLFNLHLALGISYYKTYCPKNIRVGSGKLTKNEAAFWDKLYTKGLGEFFYKNKIDYRGLVKFPWAKGLVSQPVSAKLSDQSLLPWGGGKDSVVSGERLKELGHDFTLVSLGDKEAQRATAKIIGKDRLIFTRALDPQLALLNAGGAYNGHIPISSIFAFTTVLAAALYDYKNIVFSNEASANYGNVQYLGEEINHQYSKSLEFENDIRDYLKNSVTLNINYFSLLRPYTELAIAREFSEYPKYFSAFVSCNRHYSLNPDVKTRWCGSCPKCAFVFSQLAAFLPKKTVIDIFDKNLFADKNLLPLFQELWGEKRFKPFECVGEPMEVASALLLASEDAAWKSDAIVKYFLAHRASKIKNKTDLTATALMRLEQHNIPLDFKKILLLGYGHEGRAMSRYLTNLYPRLNFTIADKKKIENTPKQAITISGDDYLQTIYEADTIIKTPGISDQIFELRAAKSMGQEITSVTNIFLSQAAERTIGVTGTKGKSTTASLVYAMLKAGGIDTELVGNIGADPLKYLGIPKKVFVYELSSYQLSLARQSPRVAIIINVFPDHLPYHGGFADYVAAKAKIAEFQNAGDTLIYNSDFPALRKIAKTSAAKKIDYLKQGATRNGWLYYGNKKIVPLSDIHLLGEHNIKNIIAAIAAAKLYGVKNVAIARAIKNFTNLKHRLEHVGQFRKLDFYDDAISTTPESTMAALDVFGSRLGVIILGGQDRGYDFSGLAKKLNALKLDGIVFFPESGKRIAEAIKKDAQHNNLKLPPVTFASNMDEAVKFCYRHTVPGRVCLLSTASPSYTLFKNFEDKGDQFQQAVKRLAKL